MGVASVEEVLQWLHAHAFPISALALQQELRSKSPRASTALAKPCGDREATPQRGQVADMSSRPTAIVDAGASPDGEREPRGCNSTSRSGYRGKQCAVPRDELAHPSNAAPTTTPWQRQRFKPYARQST
jgi:hypothetical protein